MEEADQMLKSLVTRVKNAAEAFLDDGDLVVGGWPQEQEPELHGFVVPPQETEFVQQFATESEFEQMKRRSLEYFGLIERIEKERDQWIEMWRDQAGSHMEAQSILERQLVEVRKIAVRAIAMLNQMRKDKELDPIEVRVADDLEPYDSEPVGISAAYAERQLRLKADLSSPIHAVAERNVIDSRYSDS
jgi:hypothetical protein